jgi:hypothetical protein
MWTASDTIHYYSPRKARLACGTKCRRNATPLAVNTREQFAAAVARGAGCEKCAVVIAKWDAIAAKHVAR